MGIKAVLVRFGRWAFQNAVAADRQLNAALGGSAEETLSSHSHRMRCKGHPKWVVFANFIDLMFFMQKNEEGRHFHCQRSWRREQLRRGVDWRQLEDGADLKWTRK